MVFCYVLNSGEPLQNRGGGQEEGFFDERKNNFSMNQSDEETALREDFRTGNQAAGLERQQRSGDIRSFLRYKVLVEPREALFQKRKKLKYGLKGEISKLDADGGKGRVNRL